MLHGSGCGDRSALQDLNGERDTGPGRARDGGSAADRDSASDEKRDAGGPQRDAQAAATDGGAADARVRDAAITRPTKGTGDRVYVKASNPDAEDWFGKNVALSERWLAVGALHESSRAPGLDGDQVDDSEDRSGAVYLFSNDGSGWAQQHYVKASNPGEGDNFGAALALVDGTLAVGAPDEDSAATGIDGEQGNGSGGNHGAVYVFVERDDTWQQEAYVKASNTDPIDLFGSSVALHGTTLVVGAPWEDSAATASDGDQLDDSAKDSGAAYVFERTATGWRQTAYLKAANAEAGDEFGWSVAIHGSTIAIGARGESSAATGVDGAADDNAAGDSGAVYVFERDGSGFRQSAYLKASNTRADAAFGSTLALDGDTLAIGASTMQARAGLSDSGAAYVFERNAGSWRETAYLIASMPTKEAYYGEALAIHGDALLVGALGEAHSGFTLTGAAYLYTRGTNAWTLQSRMTAPNADGGDRFGAGVAISAKWLAIGASSEASDYPGIDGDASNDRTPGAGAVYLDAR